MAQSNGQEANMEFFRSLAGPVELLNLRFDGENNSSNFFEEFEKQ